MYSAEISRANPSAFVFVIDQSGSMAEKWPDGRQQATALADAINRLLSNLVIKCAKEEGVRDYYQVGVIGYGATVGPAFGGALAGRELVPVSEIADKPVRIEDRKRKVDDGAGGLVEQNMRLPVWFEPTANDGTPMNRALGEAKRVVEAFLSQHPASFPPIVIHITDGESTDGDPSGAMRAITDLSTADGNVLLFNLHLNPAGQEIAFPGSSEQLSDANALTLFSGSSQLTPFMRSVASEHGLSVGEGARGFVMNADMTLIIQALDIGTRPANLR